MDEEVTNNNRTAADDDMSQQQNRENVGDTVEDLPEFPQHQQARDENSESSVIRSEVDATSNNEQQVVDFSQSQLSLRVQEATSQELDDTFSSSQPPQQDGESKSEPQEGVNTTAAAQSMVSILADMEVRLKETVAMALMQFQRVSEQKQSESEDRLSRDIKIVREDMVILMGKGNETRAQTADLAQNVNELVETVSATSATVTELAQSVKKLKEDHLTVKATVEEAEAQKRRRAAAIEHARKLEMHRALDERKREEIKTESEQWQIKMLRDSVKSTLSFKIKWAEEFRLRELQAEQLLVTTEHFCDAHEFQSSAISSPLYEHFPLSADDFGFEDLDSLDFFVESHFDISEPGIFVVNPMHIVAHVDKVETEAQLMSEDAFVLKLPIEFSDIIFAQPLEEVSDELRCLPAPSTCAFQRCSFRQVFAEQHKSADAVLSCLAVTSPSEFLKGVKEFTVISSSKTWDPGGPVLSFCSAE